MRLTYAVLLPTCNRAGLVEEFLRSLEQQSYPPAEVVVIDQSDDDATQHVFEQWNPAGVAKKYIHRKVKSLILARNAALNVCGAVDLVVFLDDDIELDPQFCRQIVQIFEADHDSRYAGGMGRVDGWPSQFKPLQAFFGMPHEGDGKFLSSGSPTFPHSRKEFCETEFLSGGCTFWRRKIIQQYRYDERLSGYGHCDDVDVSYRVSRRHKLFFQPAAVCFQKKDPPGRQNGRRYRYAWIQNMYYLAQKNGFSMPAYFWCVTGHFFRDLVCFDVERLMGDVSGTWNVVRGKISTVEGYQEFKRLRQQERSHA